MTLLLQRLQSLLPRLLTEERRGRPVATREAALATAQMPADGRIACELLAILACLAANEPRAALRHLDSIAIPQDPPTLRRVAVCRAWAQMLESNWYPGNIGAELPPQAASDLVTIDGVTSNDPATMLLEACAACGPSAMLGARSLIDKLRLTSTEDADRLAGDALQKLAQFHSVVSRMGVPAAAVWAQLAASDIIRRTGRLSEARQALSVVRATYQDLQDPIGVAATWLLEGDWLATPGSSPEALGLRLEDEAAPSFPEQRDDAAAADAYAQAEALLAAAQAPRAHGALELRLALLAQRSGAHQRQRQHLEAARSAFAAAGDAAAEHLACVHGWLAALEQGEFITVRTIAPLEWAELHGPVKSIAEWALARGSPSYAAGLGRLLQRRAERWALEGEFERAELACRMARGLIVLNRAVPPWVIPDALSKLDDKRGFPTRSLVRRLQILNRQPSPRPPSRDALAWLQDVYLISGLLGVPSGVTGAGLITIRLIERGVARLRNLLQLAGVSERDMTSAPVDLEARLQAIARSSDLASHLQRLETGAATQAEQMLIQLAIVAAQKMAGMRPLALLINARLVERRGWDAQADALFSEAVAHARRAGEAGRFIVVLALNAWGKREQALEEFRGMLDSPALGKDLLAPLALRAGDFARARTLFATLPIPSRDGAPGRAWSDISDRAEAELEGGDPVAAMQLAERGIQDFERMMAHLTRDPDRLDACDNISAACLYQYATRARLRNARIAEAAANAQKAAEHRSVAFSIVDRHRVLALPPQLATPAADPAVASLRQWQQAATEYATAYQRLLASLTLGTQSDASLTELLGQNERALDIAEAALTPDQRATLRERVRPRTLLVAELQALLPPDCCLLEYQLVARDLVAFAISSNTVQTAELRLNRAPDGMVSRLLRACTAGAGAAEEECQLASMLLETFAETLQRSARIIIVPSGALNALPFHILPFRGEPLGTTHVVSYLPAAALLRRGNLDRSLAHGPTLVIGDPAFDPRRHPNLRRLAGAALEAQLVAKLYASDAVFENTNAREADVRAALRHRTLLHVAAHGRLDDVAPNTSSIVLAGANELTVADFIGLQLDADLAVLSACDTGRGTTTLGGDLVGLSRGLLAAGVQRCVVSLWPVDDVTACLTMVAFHTQLRAQVPPAHALALAQREVRSLDESAIVERYRTMGGVLEAGQRSRQRSSVGTARQVSAFPEVDFSEAAASEGPLNGANPMHWAPFVLIG